MDDQKDLVVDRRLTIAITQEAGVLTLRLSGELDLENAATLDAHLRRAEESDADGIVVDLAELEFIDSSGLKSLLVAARRSELDSNRLAIRRGEGQVAKVMELTGIDNSVNLLD
jgi:anti-anti-sigma factor